MTGRRAVRVDTARVLREHLDLRAVLHPYDAVAFCYPDRDYFERSAARDREVHGNDVHGPWEADGGLIAVVDMRPQLRRLGKEPTDPVLPDAWTGGWRPAS